jgi:NADPH:quinone reductase-like Zn-dependent oxidoreductase
MVLSRFVKQLRGPGIPMPTKREGMAVLRELLEAGKITPIIDSTYPLGDVREAFRHMMEDETKGKVILTPAEAV